MDIQGLVGPAVVAAIVSGIVVISAAVISNRNAKTMHKERLAAEAALADKRFLSERALADWKRKTDLAETVLAGFYKANAIFKAARHPFARGGEGATRGRNPSETEHQARYKDAIYTPYERLNKEITFLTDLNSLR